MDTFDRGHTPRKESLWELKDWTGEIIQDVAQRDKKVENTKEIKSQTEQSERIQELSNLKKKKKKAEERGNGAETIWRYHS